MNLKEQLEAIWNDKKVRNARNRVRWVVADHTGLPAVKKAKRNSKRIYNRLTKEFSWRK